MTDTKPVWRHTDHWRKFGKDFMVEVSHWTQDNPFCEGEHRWNIYAHIYPEHPHFAAFDRKQGMWQDASNVMPLHCGASLLKFPQYDDEVTSVKVGSDYFHLHDERFSHFATKEDAIEVFHDAEELFSWLAAKAEGEAP